MTQLESVTAVAPCPFCGASASMADTGNKWMVCDDCCAEGPVSETELGAISAWNTRTPSQPAASGGVDAYRETVRRVAATGAQ